MPSTTFVPGGRLVKDYPLAAPNKDQPFGIAMPKFVYMSEELREAGILKKGGGVQCVALRDFEIGSVLSAPHTLLVMERINSDPLYCPPYGPMCEVLTESESFELARVDAVDVGGSYRASWKETKEPLYVRAGGAGSKAAPRDIVGMVFFDRPSSLVNKSSAIRTGGFHGNLKFSFAPSIVTGELPPARKNKKALKALIAAPKAQAAGKYAKKAKAAAAGKFTKKAKAAGGFGKAKGGKKLTRKPAKGKAKAGGKYGKKAKAAGKYTKKKANAGGPFGKATAGVVVAPATAPACASAPKKKAPAKKKRVTAKKGGKL